MNGAFDLGGRQGFGRVIVPDEEPKFHEEWEREIFGVIMMYFMSGICSLDQFRHGIEKMEPTEYLSTPYYMHWLRAAETVGIENNIFTADELEERVRSLAENGANL